MFIRLVLTNGIDDEALVEQIYQVGQRLTPKLMAARVRTMLRADATRELARYAGPPRYLRARDDRLVFLQSLEHIERIRRDAVSREINAPHLILQTNPRDAWRAISQFLDLKV